MEVLEEEIQTFQKQESAKYRLELKNWLELIELRFPLDFCFGDFH